MQKIKPIFTLLLLLLLLPFAYSSDISFSFYNNDDLVRTNLGVSITTNQKIYTPLFFQMPYNYTLYSGYINKVGIFMYDTTGTQIAADNLAIYKQNLSTDSGTNGTFRCLNCNLKTGSTTANITLAFGLNDTYFFNTNSVLSSYSSGISMTGWKLSIKLKYNNETSLYCPFTRDGSSVQLFVCNSTTTGQFNRIDMNFEAAASSGGGIAIHNFNVSNSGSLTENQLPYANISTTYDVCLNSTINGVFNLTIDSYDPEGDTIYYSLKKDASYMVDKYLSFDNYDTTSAYQQVSNGLFCRSFLSVLGLCTNFEKYGVSIDFPSDEDIDTDCSMMDNVNYVSEFNRSIFYSFEESNGYKLSWNISKCQNKRLSIFNSETKYNESLYSLSYMIQPLNNTVFTVNPSYDNFFTSVDPITINRTAGKTYFFIGNSRFNTTTWKLEVRTFLDLTNNVYTLNLYDYSSYFDSNPIYTKTKTLLGPNYPYISINGLQGFVYLDDVIFWRENSNVTFTTTKPTEIKFSKTGTFYNTLYVSDEIHQPDEYITVPFTLRVDECKYTSVGIANQNNYGDLVETGDLIGFFNVLLGVPFRNYMSELDENDIAQTIIWWAYLIVFFGLFIFNYFNQKSADLILPLIISSGCILIVSILGGYTPSLIVSIIGLAFGFGIPLSSSFGGQNGR